MSKESVFRMLAVSGALTLALAVAAPTGAAIVDEDFNTVLGTGGGVFLNGSGESTLVDWDDGIVGETAFGNALLHAHATMQAVGDTSAGVGGSGAGVLTVSGLSLNMMDENFDSVTGTGGGAFVVGDGLTPDVGGGVTDWDGGIGGESAFFSCADGAILVGDVSAQGLPGVDGAGQMIVDNVDVTIGGWYGGLSWQIPGFPAGSAAVLVNGGFDADGYNPPFTPGFEPTGWTIGGDGFWLQDTDWHGNVYLEGGLIAPHSSPVALKMWSAWWAGSPSDTYLHQDLPAQEGQTWEIDCFTQNLPGDSLTGGMRAEMRIEFYDAGDVLLDSAVVTILDLSSPLGSWIDNSPLQLIAPAGTATARGAVAFVDAGTGGAGAAYFDDVTFDVVSGPPAFNLGQFSLSADARGEANTGAGEIFGHYQLRLEDSSGARLVFQSAAVADGNWTPIGGTLDNAVEMDADGLPASGVFNPGSTTFTVVVAFDNQRAPYWGTGGTLEVDNLLMPNDNASGSEYYAGFYWDDLTPPATDDPRELTMTADVLGNIVGGDYQLKLEGFSHVLNVDEDFSGATGTGGIQLVYPGGETGDSLDWDDGIDGPRAFGGVANGIVTEPSGGIWAQGDPNGYAVLEAHEIALGAEGNWWVGLAFENQRLPSTDLSTVNMTANIKGTWNGGLLESASLYALRIEDAQGDWIGWEGTVNGAWNPVGGLLSAAPDSGNLGGGDDTFDLDTDAAYKVVVVMTANTINDWGGTLYVDNVFLTPSPNPLKVERGSITFSGSADGNFQTVGGLLNTGVSTWPVVGGEVGGYSANWDRGIDGEEAFSGGYLAGVASMYVEGCPGCGMGGSGGGQFTASGIFHDDLVNGVYWAGLAWHNVPIDLSDLSKVRLTADVKGVWDTTPPGSVAGKVVIRAEDNNENYLEFTADADGVWHSIGGALNTATVTGNNPPFNYSLGSYGFVVIIATHDTAEGPAATITVDNLRVEYNDGSGFADVLFEDFETVAGPTPGFLNDAGVLDSVTLAVTMENGVATWGGEGGPCLGDLNGDGAIGLPDLAALLSAYGVNASGDLDNDGDTDLADLAKLLSLYGTSCATGATMTLDNLFFEVTP